MTRTSTTTAAKTSSIVGAILEDHLLRSPGPAFLTIDLNADPEDVDQVMVLLSTHGWQNLGAIASTWSDENDVATCLTARSNLPTCRDYIFANRLALALVRGFKIFPADFAQRTLRSKFILLSMLQPTMSASSERLFL